MGSFQVYLGVFHQLEKVSLYTTSRYIGSAGIASGGNLIDLVEVNDTVFGPVNITICLVNHLPDQVFNVTTHVTRFTELGGISLNKRNTDPFGNQLDNICFPNTGRSNQQHVTLDVSQYFFIFRDLMFNIHPVKVCTHLGCYHFNGLFLANNILVQVTFKLLRFYIKIEL